MRFNFVLFAIVFMNGIIISLTHTLYIPDQAFGELSPSDPSDYEDFISSQEQDNLRRHLGLNSTEYLNGIPHILIDKTNEGRIKKIIVFEKDFLNLLLMKSYNYVYKRDNHWRTWREIDEPDGSKTIISYRCDNNAKTNCTKCHSNGFWTIISSPPPCPYEVFAIIDDNLLCAANYSQLNKLNNNTCSYKTTFADFLKSCDNPIHTKWRFTKNYNKQHKPSKSIICDDQEICEFETTYKISPEQIVFTIVNSSNNIIFSRIMKKGEINYACVENCGSIKNNSTKPPHKMHDVVDKENKSGEKKWKPTPKTIVFPVTKFVGNDLPWEAIDDEEMVSDSVIINTSTKTPNKKTKAVHLNNKNKSGEKKRKPKPKVIVFPVPKFVGNDLPWEKTDDDEMVSDIITSKKPSNKKQNVEDLNKKNKNVKEVRKIKPKVIVFPSNKFVENGLPWQRMDGTDLDKSARFVRNT